MNYVPVTVNNLQEIQAKVMELFPEENKKRTVLFYIENSVEQFLKIDVLKEQLEQLGLVDSIAGVAFYHVMPNGEQGGAVHIDYGDSVYSFNLPISGCDNTFVNFYSCSEQPEKRFNSAGVPYYYLDPKACQKIDAIEMTQPYIINVKQPHNIVNANGQNRITLLIRLKGSWDYTAWISRQSNCHSASKGS